MGQCESGKTQMFSQLCHGIDVISVTSVKESAGTYMTGKVGCMETFCRICIWYLSLEILKSYVDE